MRLFKRFSLFLALLASILVVSSPLASAAAPKDFGVVSDPWAIRNWTTSVGASPTMAMEFEAWSRNRTLDTHFAQAKLNGYSSYLITWEPWAPVPASAGRAAQAAPQPLYSNAAIASGSQDAYIHMFAKSVANSGLNTVYIRYAHEMNGDWYPWSTDSTNFKIAWRRIVTIFRAEGATNAKFVYSTNPSLYQDDATWTKGFWKYWPGGSYVDYVGSTMINFGSKPCAAIPCPGDSKGYSVALFKQRIIMGYKLTGKQLIITEFNTAFDGAQQWLTDLNAWLATGTSWIQAVVLSQAPSRGSQQMPTGNLSWSVMDYPVLYPVMQQIIHTTTGR